MTRSRLIFLFLLACSAATILPALAQDSYNIPSWIKNNAKWWSQGQVGYEDFIKGIQYLIQQGIMKIPKQNGQSAPTQQIPAWIKTNAGWWAQGQISDEDFVKGIQWLVSNGIINPSSGPHSAQSPTNGTLNDLQTYASKDYGFSMNYPAGWQVDDNPKDNTYSNVTISEPNGNTFIEIGHQKGVLKLYSLADFAHKTFDQIQSNSNSTYIGEASTSVAGRDAYFIQYIIADGNSNDYVKQVFVNANGKDVYFIVLVTNDKSTKVLEQFDGLLSSFSIIS